MTSVALAAGGRMWYTLPPRCRRAGSCNRRSAGQEPHLVGREVRQAVHQNPSAAEHVAVGGIRIQTVRIGHVALGEARRKRVSGAINRLPRVQRTGCVVGDRGDVALHHVERHHVAAVLAVLPVHVGPRRLDGGHHRVQSIHCVGIIAVVGIVRVGGLGALLDHVLAVLQNPVDVVIVDDADAFLDQPVARGLVGKAQARLAPK